MIADRKKYLNVIITAIGGEDSEWGALRFERDVLSLYPWIVIIDYGLNDRRIGLKKAKLAWKSMIEKCLENNIKVLLLTPTLDSSGLFEENKDQWNLLRKHDEQIRKLAEEYEVGLVDCFSVFENYIRDGGDIMDLLSWPNHPNRKGHELIAREILR